MGHFWSVVAYPLCRFIPQPRQQGYAKGAFIAKTLIFYAIAYICLSLLQNGCTTVKNCVHNVPYVCLTHQEGDRISIGTARRSKVNGVLIYRMTVRRSKTRHAWFMYTMPDARPIFE